jgi:hypothetical protein
LNPQKLDDLKSNPEKEAEEQIQEATRAKVEHLVLFLGFLQKTKEITFFDQTFDVQKEDLIAVEIQEFTTAFEKICEIPDHEKQPFYYFLEVFSGVLQNQSEQFWVDLFACLEYYAKAVFTEIKNLELKEQGSVSQ